MEILFGGIMLVGLGYLLLIIFSGIGDAPDLGVDSLLDSTGLDTAFGFDAGGETNGLGCGVLSAFLAGFGAVGLTVTLSGLGVLESLILALVSGYVLGRVVLAVMQFVLRQQSAPHTFSAHDLVGTTARVTINFAAGTTGEVMIEKGEIVKYAVKEIDGAPLSRGDTVLVVESDGRLLHVRKVTD